MAAQMINWFRKTPAPIIRWEYTMLPMTSVDGESEKPTDYLEMMNAMGLTGWELVGMISNCMVFKKVSNAQVR